MVVGGGCRAYLVTDGPQVPAVENVVEHVRAAAPGDLLRLHRPITSGVKLPHERLVLADIEIAPKQRRSLRGSQRIDDELSLVNMLLARAMHKGSGLAIQHFVF